MHVVHHPAEQSFTVSLDGHEAELTYARPEADLLDFQHTWVDENLRGRGVADAMAAKALEFARHEKARVRLTCPFMRQYVERHRAAWADLAIET